MHMMNAVRMFVTALGLSIVLGSTSACAETLSLSQAVAMVMSHHEGLEALREERASAEAAIRQASAYPNPEIEVGAEDFGRAEVEALGVAVLGEIPRKTRRWGRSS